MSEELRSSEHEKPDHRSPDFSKGKTRIFLVISLLVPVAFISLLELSLHFFKYGSSYEQWVESNNGQWIEEGGTMLMLNPAIASKYFHVQKNIPFANEEAFDKAKKPNSFRVFVLGESSAAGYPFEPNGSFSRYLSDRLSLAYPDSKIEVINCSMSAINSYTLRDLTPGILEQKPDLILIYAGHNEYYGALGVGSLESLGQWRFIVNLAIGLEKYRTFQLVRSAVNAVKGIFASKEDIPSGTLMTRMARNQYIEHGSAIYEKGLSQFDGNMDDILKMITSAHVPVIMGTLTCNLKDQHPFVSISSSQSPPADEIFKEAREALEQKKPARADSLFRAAKDLDALRFRAPTEINTTIVRLARKYDVQVVHVDSAFSAESPEHIVGNNLMVDHLHPTLHGYQLMGKLFYAGMEAAHYLPHSQPINLPDKVQDSITLANFSFTALDSLIAEYKTIALKNNWPFVENAGQFSYSNYLHPKHEIDSLAAQFVERKISWKNAHLSAAGWYLEKKDITQFLKEMDVIVNEYPYVIQYYQYIVSILLPLKEYEQVFRYLSKSCTIEPDAFNTKWLGLILIDRGEMDSARLFLNQSLRFESGDPQVWYNLAVTYLHENKNETLALLDRALAVDPAYQNALSLRKQVLNSMK